MDLFEMLEFNDDSEFVVEISIGLKDNKTVNYLFESVEKRRECGSFFQGVAEVNVSPRQLGLANSVEDFWRKLKEGFLCVENEKKVKVFDIDPSCLERDAEVETFITSMSTALKSMSDIEYISVSGVEYNNTTQRECYTYNLQTGKYNHTIIGNDVITFGAKGGSLNFSDFQLAEKKELEGIVDEELFDELDEDDEQAEFERQFREEMLYYDNKTAFSQKAIKAEAAIQLNKKNKGFYPGFYDADDNKIYEWDKKSKFLCENYYSERSIVEDSKSMYNFLNAHPEIEKIVVPVGIKKIGAYSFARCNYIKTVILPDSVEEISKCAFQFSRKIKNIVFGRKIKRILDSAFCGLVSLESVEIESEKIQFQSFCFQGCERLKRIRIDSKETVFMAGAFSSCNHLMDISIKGETEFESGVFRNTAWSNEFIRMGKLAILNNVVFYGNRCSGNVIIPEGVTTICDKAFYSNKEITAATLPKSLRTIGDSAFADCENLCSIEFNNPDVYMGYSVFDGTEWLERERNKSALVVVGNTLVDGKKSDGCLCIPDEISYIVPGAFEESSIEAVLIPDGITEINKYTFYECSSLEMVVITSSVQKIDKYAFTGCEGIKRLSIPERFREEIKDIFASSLDSIETITYV